MITRSCFLHGAAILVAALAAPSCNSHECRGGNASEKALRQVPVPAAYAPQGAAAGAEAEGTVKRQTYTIDEEGNFTFQRTLERKVGHLGIEVDNVDRKAAEEAGVEPFGCVLVRSVKKDGPARNAGIRANDIIVKFAGETGLNMDRLEYLVDERKPGDKVEIEVARGKERSEIVVELGSIQRIESAKGVQEKLRVMDDRNHTGLRFVEPTDEVRPIILAPAADEKGLLIIDVMPGGPAFFAGLLPRDYLVHAGENAITSMEDYTRARGAWKVGEDVTFTVRRGSLTHETSVKIAANATSETSYEIPAVIRYRNRPSDCDLSILLGGLLFNYHSCFDLKVRETEPPAAERTSRRKWGAVLDLLEYERRSNGRKHVRLLWLIPIYWGGD